MSHSSYYNYVVIFSCSQVLLETLRLCPPVGGFAKVTPKGGMKLSGYDIPQNTIVQV